MSPTPELRLELVSKPAYLCGVRELIGGVAQQFGFVGPQAHRIVLAVDEALANVIVHGYQRREDGSIRVDIFRVGDHAATAGIRIVIEDDGRTVDPATIRSRELADIRPGGLGVHIIREIMDQVTYEPRPSGGMRLTLVKHLAPVLAGTKRGSSGECDCQEG